MKKISLAFALAVLITCPAGAQTVVASTSWTAAFAQLAGAETVEYIAPAGMIHPAEYEITPKDILRVAKADFFVCAGYEVMTKALTGIGCVAETKVIRIATKNDWATISSQVRFLAARLGTGGRAEKNLAALKIVYDKERTEFSSIRYKSKKYLVHSFQMPIVRMLGLPVVGTFGPAPLSQEEISDLSATGADVIIDNIHNPVALPLSQLLKKCPLCPVFEFPRHEGNHDTCGHLRVQYGAAEVMQDRPDCRETSSMCGERPDSFRHDDCLRFDHPLPGPGMDGQRSSWWRTICPSVR
ncbi:MAG TPA: ABC transporter substrate-binding protein [Candidatus Aminicenantes bacterium]|nr:ABC transporter substrate-binding protein [Candidatus Aminicenantes bacterium]